MTKLVRRLFVFGGCIALAQTPAPLLRPGIKVLPVFFVPLGELPPTDTQMTNLMHYLTWTQQRYRDMLNNRATFDLATTRPIVYRGRETTAFYRSQLDGGAAQYVTELLGFVNYDRFNCPFVFLVMYMSPINEFPAGGGRPLNGGFNTGGGVVILSSYTLDRTPNFQSTLEHELGHSFGLAHVDVYGYSMSTNRSIMSYNLANWTNFFAPSPTPGILIPEDIRGLSANKLAFPTLEFLPSDVSAGYQIRTAAPLGPMDIPEQASYQSSQLNSATYRLSSALGSTGALVATTSAPNPSYRWIFQGKTINGASSSSFVMSKLQASNAGSYSVEVTSAEVPTVSAPVSLTVTPTESLAAVVASATSATLPPIASNGSLTVTPASASYLWKAATGTSWLTITSSASGRGPTTVDYKASANPSRQQRTAEITVAGLAFPITQMPACTEACVDGVRSAPGVVTSGLAPGSLIALNGRFGTDLASVSLEIADSVGARRGMTFTLVGGSLNAIVPAETALGGAIIRVLASDQSPQSFPVNIVAVAPAIFTGSADGSGPAAATLVRSLADGSELQQSSLACGAAPGTCVPVYLDLGAGDDARLVLTATGIRNRSSLDRVGARIDGVDITVLEAGAIDDHPGVDRVVLQLPGSLAGHGNTPLNLTVDGIAANPVGLEFGATMPTVAARNPRGFAVASDGTLVISDTGGNRVFRVMPNGILAPIVGTGVAGLSGDGGPAVAARLLSPFGLAFDSLGNLLISDLNNASVRQMSRDGIITRLAGTGSLGYSGDGGPAVKAQLSNRPYNIAADPQGGVYIADTLNHCIRRVTPDGIISTFAGSGVAGFSGDGGPATQAQLRSPTAIALDGSGNLYIADHNNQRVRVVTPDGTINTFAGDGKVGYSGDGGPAVSASLSGPWSVAVDGDGAVYIADFDNQRIRRVAPDGTISTSAGNGTKASDGDGGPAAGASLSEPIALAFGPDGSLFVLDSSTNRIRRITPDGTINTIFGPSVP